MDSITASIYNGHFTVYAGEDFPCWVAVVGEHAVLLLQHGPHLETGHGTMKFVTNSTGHTAELSISGPQLGAFNAKVEVPEPDGSDKPQQLVFVAQIGWVRNATFTLSPLNSVQLPALGSLLDALATCDPTDRNAVMTVLRPEFAAFVGEYVRRQVADVDKFAIGGVPPASDIIAYRRSLPGSSVLGVAPHPAVHFRGPMSYTAALWYRERQSNLSMSPSKPSTLSTLNGDVMWTVLTYMSGLPVPFGSFVTMNFWGAGGGGGAPLTIEERVGEVVMSVRQCVSCAGVPVVGAKWVVEGPVGAPTKVTLTWSGDRAATRSTKPVNATIAWTPDLRTFKGTAQFPGEGVITWCGGKSRAALVNIVEKARRAVATTMELAPLPPTAIEPTVDDAAAAPAPSSAAAEAERPTGKERSANWWWRKKP